MKEYLMLLNKPTSNSIYNSLINNFILISNYNLKNFESQTYNDVFSIKVIISSRYF